MAGYTGRTAAYQQGKKQSAQQGAAVQQGPVNYSGAGTGQKANAGNPGAYTGATTGSQGTYGGVAQQAPMGQKAQPDFGKAVSGIAAQPTQVQDRAFGGPALPQVQRQVIQQPMGGASYNYGQSHPAAAQQTVKPGNMSTVDPNVDQRETYTTWEENPNAQNNGTGQTANQNQGAFKDTEKQQYSQGQGTGQLAQDQNPVTYRNNRGYTTGPDKQVDSGPVVAPGTAGGAAGYGATAAGPRDASGALTGQGAAAAAAGEPAKTGGTAKGQLAFSGDTTNGTGVVGPDNPNYTQVQQQPGESPAAYAKRMADIGAEKAREDGVLAQDRDHDGLPDDKGDPDTGDGSGKPGGENGKSQDQIAALASQLSEYATKPAAAVANQFNTATKDSMNQYYNNYDLLDKNKEAGDALLDPEQQAAADKAQRDQMLADISGERDESLRMEMARANRGGRAGSGSTQGIYDSATRQAQEGSRKLAQDQFSRMMDRTKTGAGINSDVANTIYGLQQQGFTSPKEIAAMLAEMFGDLGPDFSIVGG